VLGELIEHPVTLRLADVGAHPHSFGFPPEHPDMKTFLGVPVLVGEQPFGNLYLAEKAGGEPFSEEDARLVGLLAEFAGVAIDHRSSAEVEHTNGLKRACEQDFCRFRRVRPVCLQTAANRRPV